jgi:hypothetical protein
LGNPDTAPNGKRRRQGELKLEEKNNKKQKKPREKKTYQQKSTS